MARIRTVKPEFWTDEVIVQLPFQARLLFIGIWNFADDHGAIEESPDRLRMQIFPGDPTLDAVELIDLLVAANLLERFVDDEGKRIIQVRNWHKHQKVDNPAKSRILSEKYRKLAIPSEARRAVAIKYGCFPGSTKDVGCYFCGLPGKIHWWNRSDGKPSAWVVFDLELDHLHPEVDGGANSAENLVLSCRSCNRGRRDKLALPWILSRTLATPSEDSPSEGKGKGREKEGKGGGEEARTREQPEGDRVAGAIDFGTRLTSVTPTSLLEDWRRDVPECNPEAFSRWVVHVEESGRPMTPAMRLAQARRLAGNGDFEAQAEVVTYCAENGYKSLIPIADVRHRTKGHDPPGAPSKLSWRPPPDEEPTRASG